MPPARRPPAEDHTACFRALYGGQGAIKGKQNSRGKLSSVERHYVGALSFSVAAACIDLLPWPSILSSTHPVFLSSLLSFSLAVSHVLLFLRLHKDCPHCFDSESLQSSSKSRFFLHYLHFVCDVYTIIGKHWIDSPGLDCCSYVYIYIYCNYSIYMTVTIS